MSENTNSPAVAACRSRWGWHPCGYETFLLLKRLFAHWQEAQRRRAEWERWARKAPHNRLVRQPVRDVKGRIVGRVILGPWTEPPLCPVFLVKRQEVDQFHPDSRYDWETKQWSGPLRDVVRPVRLPGGTEMGAAVEADYRNASNPRADPSEVRPLTLTEAQLREMLAWLEGAGA